MIWIAVWFTFMVLNIVDCVLDRINDAHGWVPVINAGFLGLSAYFFFDAVRNQWPSSDDSV